MSLTGNLETNALGGGGFGSGFGGAGFGFGGFGGGIPPVGLFGVIDRDRHGHGDHGHGKDCDGSLFLLNAIGNLKDTVVNAKDSLNEQIDSVRDNMDQRLDSVKDALTSRVENVKDNVVAESRALGAAVCDAEKTNLQQFYAAAIQAANNTQAIKDQASAYAIVADKRFDDLAAAGVAQTAAILAKLNQTELDNLRDRLNERTREVDANRIEINNINTNTNVLTAIQSIKYETDRRFDALFGSFNQLNRNTQDVINFGTMAASANQANQQTNVK